MPASCHAGPYSLPPRRLRWTYTPPASTQRGTSVIETSSVYQGSVGLL